MTKKTLDTWLGDIYQADIRLKADPLILQFKTTLENDDTLMTEVRARLVSLNEMIAARGERACAYSAKYCSFLQKALA